MRLVSSIPSLILIINKVTKKKPCYTLWVQC